MIDSTAPGMLALFVAFLVALPLVVIVAGRLRLPYTVVLVVVAFAAVVASARSSERPRLEAAATTAGVLSRRRTYRRSRGYHGARATATQSPGDNHEANP